MNNKSAAKIQFWDIIWAALFAAGCVFIWWKCRYGFGNADESFYLTIPFRLTQGDGLFSQEWHLSQMSGFLLYPFMKLYLLFAGGLTEGIILAFRHIYTVVNAAAAAFLYIRLRSISKPGAAAGSICFLLYAPFGIMALSYNSMGLISLAICFTIMLTARRARRIQEIIAGLFFAAAVLCCPYLIFVFVLYLVAVIFTYIFKKKEKFADTGLNIKSWLFFTIGAGILAVAFAGFILSRASISEIIYALPNILNDPSHARVGILTLIGTYFSSIIAVSRRADAGYICLVCLMIAAIIDRKRRQHGWLYISLGMVVTVATIIFLIRNGNYINFIMFPVNIMAVLCLIICPEKPVLRVFFTFWVPGMLYTVCLHATSNQQFYAISSASTTSLIGSLIIVGIAAEYIWNSCREGKAALKWKAKRCVVIVGVCVLIATQIGSLAYMRYWAVFWDRMNNLQNVRQEFGVEKGLYLSDEAEKQYKSTLELKSYIDENYSENGYAAFISNNTWMYLLCGGFRNGAYSAWLAEVDGSIEPLTIEKLMDYYEVNPQAVPDLVYFEERNTVYVADYMTVADYEEDILENGDIILYRSEN